MPLSGQNHLRLSRRSKLFLTWIHQSHANELSLQSDFITTAQNRRVDAYENTVEVSTQMKLRFLKATRVAVSLTLEFK